MEERRDIRKGKLPLPVGKSDWEEVAEHCYCIDKTLMVRDLLQSRAGVALFTRPRRFGKTTAMQMLKCFFEKRGEGEENVRPLFESRAIAHCEGADEWMSHQGKYPVIYLTFKDHKALTWESAQYRLESDITSELCRHRAAAESLDAQKEKDLFLRICDGKPTIEELGLGLGLLAKALHLHHKVKPRPNHRDFPAVIIEVKAAKTDDDDLDALAAEARRQIDEKNYAASLEAEGITDIMKFGYAFHSKKSAIR